MENGPFPIILLLKGEPSPLAPAHLERKGKGGNWSVSGFYRPELFVNSRISEPREVECLRSPQCTYSYLTHPPTPSSSFPYLRLLIHKKEVVFFPQ
jgi:hypothetical protein